MKTHSWQSIKNEKLSPARQAAVTEQARVALNVMPLQEFRQGKAEKSKGRRAMPVT